MVGIIAVCLLVVHIYFTSPVVCSLVCPEGIRSFSNGVESDTYYECEKGRQEPVLKKCKPGEFYWAHKGACHGLENAAKTGGRSDLVIYTRASLGETVFLGDLYDSNTDEIFTGYSLWKRETILNSRIRSTTPGVTVDIFPTRTKTDRLQSNGFSYALKTDILGELIRVKGSSLYLIDNLKSDKEAAVILTYQATTQTDTLPVSTPQDFDKCEDSSPTHVVTSVTYGIQANFIFRKMVEEDENIEEVLDDLVVAVKEIKTTKSDVSESVVKNVDVEFFADFVREKEPGTYEESLHMYQSLPSRVGKFPKYSNNTVPIEIRLMPITKFCNPVRTKVKRHIAISDDILNSIGKMLDDIEKTKLKINTLKMRKIVRNYEPITETLQILFDELNEFELRMKTDLQITIPSIRGGNSSEEDLIVLLNQYYKSPLHYTNVKPFLHNRLREINMLNYVLLPEKRESTDVKVVNYEDVTDIQTMFVKPFVLMLKFNILTPKLIVHKFLKGEKIEESKSWYNDPYIISAMGLQFNNFIKFSSFNRNSKIHGYLLAIADAKENAININAQKEGLIYTFTFPSIPPKVNSTSNTHQSITFHVKRPAGTWITGFNLSYWKYGRPSEITSRTFQFSRENTTIIIIDQLMPNNVYQFLTQYVTPMGLSQQGPSVTFGTRPCSPPTNLRTSVLSADYIKIYWDPPSMCGKDVNIKKYNVTVVGLNNFIRTIIVEGKTNVEIPRLQAASAYDVRVTAIFDKRASGQLFNLTQGQAIVTTLPSTLKIITLPDAPLHLSLINRSIHSALVAWEPTTKVATGAVVQKYHIKYVISNDLGNISKKGTEMTISTSNTSYILTDLMQGTTYSVSVQVVTSLGSSEYSPKLILKTMFKESELDYLRHTFEKEIEHLRIQMQNRLRNESEQLESSIGRVQTSLRNESHRVRYIKVSLERSTESLRREIVENKGKTNAVTTRVGALEKTFQKCVSGVTECNGCGGTGGFSTTKTIQYGVTFSKNPTIMVAIRNFDRVQQGTDDVTWGIRVYVSSTMTTQFNVFLEGYNSYVYKFAVSWIACGTQA